LAALSQKKIAAAVNNVSDREDWSRNVIIYGLKEGNGEDVK
jgi:hypothetical protein